MLEKNNGKNNSNRNRRVGTSKNNKTIANQNNSMNKKTYGIKGKKTKNAKNKTKTKKIVIRVLIGLLVAFLIAMAVIAGIIIGIFKKYKVPLDKIRASMENTIIFDTDGNVIATLSANEKRNSITLEEMSPYIPKAFIAIEDERFYEHDGFDIKRTAAATIGYIFKGGGSSFGGSTITQQLIKNITKEDQRDATRKIKEIARAYNLEKELEQDKTKSQAKDEILQLYLNTIFMGGEEVCGVQLGSRMYFNKDASELDLAEAAFLAGINHSPNAYKPFEDSDEMREKIKNRTMVVLDKMLELNKINSEEYNTAKEKVQNGLTFTKGEIHTNVYSYHTDALIEQVLAQIQEENPDMNRKAAEYYLYNGGLRIYSTQVSSIQKIMEEEYNTGKYIITRTFTEKDENGNTVQKTESSQSAMVIIDYKSGQVVGAVGGFGEKTARCLNRATQGVKQAGSSLKPLAVIAPSLQEGLITAGTVIDDTPVSYPGWTPNNDDHTFWGLTTVRSIIRSSRNIPEIKMINTLTPML